jgi:hypothetical protein
MVGGARAATIALAVVALACCATQPAAAPRKIDSAPRVSALKDPLPDHRAEAFFSVNTGGDQMTLSRKQAGLELVVRYQAKELRQTIASCEEPSTGSALGGGTERELEVALCGGEYWLIAEPGQVLVERKDSTPPALVSAIPLPWSSVRAQAARDR